MLLNSLNLHNPTSTQQAAKLFKELEDAKVLAGGTFLINSLKLFKHKGIKTPKNVISLSHIVDLKGIECKGNLLTIKAMTTISELLESPIIADKAPIIKTICRNISTTPIRNMASFGGNLTCRYTWTELPVVMIAYDADMFFMSADGKEISIKAEDFFKNSAKSESLFTRVEINLDTQDRLSYRRARKMSDVDQPLLSLCVKTRLINNVTFAMDKEGACKPIKEGSQKAWSNTRVVINSGIAFAQRDYLLEKFLDGKASSDDLGIQAMGSLTTSIYDTRSTEYKQHLFRISIQRAIEEICKSN